jgi:hypothetical protein
MEYMPAGSKPVTTFEVVDFTTAVTLSQLFQSLAETTYNLGCTYELSEDDSLIVFAERYYTLASEAELLSHTITAQLSSYDKLISVNTAIIADISKSDWCTLGCVAIGAGVCIVSFFFAPLLTICGYYLDYIYTYGCEFCGFLDIIDQNQGTSGIAMPKWISSVHSASWSGTAAGVTSASNICGSYNDGNFARIYAGNIGDQAVIIGVMVGPAKGDIWLHGYTGTGYYTDYQVWVSNDGVNWGSSPLYSSYTPGLLTVRNIYGGYASSTFNYISIVCYNTGTSCNLYVDCVATTN